jgi:hypothetical protein
MNDAKWDRLQVPNTPMHRRTFLPLVGGLLGAAASVQSDHAQSGVAAGRTNPLADPGTGTGIVLGAGTHVVTTNTTLRTSLHLMPGARLDIAAGRTLRVLGDFHAPAEAVLVGKGLLDLNASTAAFARPEWWGAQPDGSVDCRPALEASLLAHPVMQLAARDYLIGTTWRIDRPFCRVRGLGTRGTAIGQGTRIVIGNAQDDVLHVGPQTAPSSVNDFIHCIAIEGLTLARSQPADGPAAGLRAQFLLYCEFTDLTSLEQGQGFVCTGLVRTRLRNCAAFRSLPGRSRSTWRGFHLDGTRAIGLAGGNASLFLEDCNASIGGDPKVDDGVALLLEGAFADSFIINFECAGVATGIRVDGSSARIGARADAGHVNLHVRMPILDQCSAIGIDIRDCSPSAIIDFSNVYVALAPSATAALRLTDMRGSMTISGGQLLGGMNNASGAHAIGLEAWGSAGLALYGTRIQDVARPIILTGCARCDIRVQIGNALHPAKSAAITISECTNMLIAPIIHGAPRTFSCGVALSSSKGPHSLDLAGIDSASLQPGAPAIAIDGASVTRAGRMGDITLSGI